MASTRWSSPFIEYCASLGIIAGNGDGTFDPTGELTGHAFAKMLLVALGYDSAREGYTGAGWSIEVAKDAVTAGIDVDGVALSDEVTREVAAQMCLNTLEATMVEYATAGTVVTTPDGTTVVTSGSNASKVEAGARATDYGGGDEDYVEFCEQYFDDLEKDSANVTDDFGRPSIEWIYDGDSIGTYADDADETYVVDDDSQTVLDILTDSDYMNYDGSDIDDTPEVTINGEDADEDDTVYVGDIVEAYEDDDGIVTDVVVRRYTVAVVDSLETDLSTTEEGNGASVMITLADLDGNELDDYYDAYDDDEDVLAGYNSNYEEGTVLAVAFYGNDTPSSYAGGGQVLDSYVDDVASGAITGTRSDRLTVDGTRYYYTGFAAAEYSSEDFDFDEDYDVYLTAEGFIIGVDGATGVSLDDVYYVTGVYRTSGTYGGYDYFAQAVSLTDGTIQEIELDIDDADNVLDADAIVDEIAGDSDGFYTGVAGLYAFDDDVATEAYVDGDDLDDYTVVRDSSLSEDVDVDDTRINVNGRYYLSSSTQYLAVDDTADDVEVATATGGMTVSTGSGDIYIIADGRDAVYVVFAGLDASSVASEVIYIADTDYDRVASDQYENEDVYFVESGEQQTIVLDDDYSSTGFYEVDDIDSDEVYSLRTSSPMSDLATGTIDEDTDDGAIHDLTIPATTSSVDHVQNSGLTTNDDGVAIANYKFDDVSMANATVIDTRGSSTRNGDPYTREINSVSRLDAALDEANVTVDLYLMDGEIVFVAVTSMGDAVDDGGDDEPADGEYEIIGFGGTVTSEDPVDLDVYGDTDAVDSDVIGEWLEDQGYTSVSSDGSVWTFSRGYTTYTDVTINVTPIYLIEEVVKGNDGVDRIVADKEYVNVGDTITFTLTRDAGFSGTYNSASVDGLTVDGSATVTRVNSTTYTVQFEIGGTISDDIESVTVTLTNS